MKQVNLKNRRLLKIFLPIAFGTAFSLWGDATLYTVLPTHTPEAGILLGAVGIILGINRAVRILSNGAAGWLYDHFSQKRLFILAMFIGALSTSCYAVAHGFWLLFAGRVIWGMAWSLIWVGGGTIILNFTEETDRGRWTGFYQTWFFFGAGSGAFFGGILTDQVGYHNTMWIAAFVTALSGCLVLVFLPEIPKRREKLETPEGLKKIEGLFSRHLWLTAIIQGFNRFCFAGVLYPTMGLLVKERLLSANFLIGTATLTGILMAGRTLISMLTAPLAGSLSDKIGSRWKVILWAFIAGIITMLLLVTGSPVLIILGISGSAVIASAVQSLVIALTGDLVGTDQRGKAIGILHTIGDLGSAIGPPCAYALLPVIGLTGVYLLCAGLFVIGFFLLFLQTRIM
jgi:MFS family permease